MILKSLNPHSITNDETKLLLYKEQRSNVKHYIDSSFEVDMYLTEKQFDILSDLIGRPITTPKSTKSLKHHPHPIPFILNRLAYDTIGKQFGHIDGVIDIGGSPLRTPKNHHICSLVNDMRTNSRYANIAMKQMIDDPNNYNYLLEEQVSVESFTSWSDRNIFEIFHGIKKGFRKQNWQHGTEDMLNRFRPKRKYGTMSKPCIHGAQLCDHKSFHAYMINVYDIPLADFTIIFQKHDIKTLDCFMFLPDILIDPSYVLDQTYYGCRFIQRNYWTTHASIDTTKVQFDLKDDANIYEHSYRCWKEYLTTTVIHGTTFSIVIEIINSWGTFKQLRFTKVNSDKGIITRSISMKRYDSYYKTPNVVHWFAHKTHDIMTKNFILPRNFVDSVITHAVSLQDVAYTYKNVYSYARSTKTSVRFINEGVTNFVYAGLECSEPEFQQIVLSLFIISAVRRRAATMFISDVFKELKHIDDFWECFTNCLYTLVRKFRNQDKLKVKWEIKEEVFKNITDINNEVIPTQYFENVIDSYNDEFESELVYIPTTLTTPKFDKVSTSSKTTTTTKTPPPEPIKLKPTAPSEPKSVEKDEKRHTGVIIRQDRLGTVYRVKVSSGMACVRKIHSNAGGGRCGFLALQHFSKTPLIVDDKHKLMLDKAEWFSTIDLIDIAKKNNLNLIVHIFDATGLVGIEEAYVDKAVNTAKIMWRNHHFEAVDCICPGSGVVLGQFETIAPQLPNMIHVNACNVDLTDGGGQAAAFRSVYPNYADKISKPIPSGIPYEILHGKMKLCLFAAHNNSVKYDMKSTFQAYQNLNKYIDQSKQPVLTPLVGTAIYKTPMCCMIHNLTSYNIVFNYRDENSIQCYYDTLNCTHGGALFGVKGNLSKVPIQPSPHYDYVNVLDDNKDKNKMNDKYSEIHRHLCDFASETCSPEWTFLDLTAELGAFAKSHQKIANNTYICYSDSQQQYPTPIRPYSQYVKDKTVVIWDYFPCDDLTEIIKTCANMNVYVVFKIDPFKNLDPFYNKLNVLIIKCDASRFKSGELYAIHKIGQHIDEAHDLQPKFNDHDESNVQYVKCSCVFDKNKLFQGAPFFNGSVTIDVTDKDYAEYLIGWESNTTVKLNVNKDEYLKNQRFKIPVCNGVAGCAKTSTVRKMGVCRNCTMIISPFNTHKYAFTFEVALKFLLSKASRLIRTVFVDEIYVYDARYLLLLKNILDAHHPGYILTAGGDHKQTRSPDFSGRDVEVLPDDINGVVPYHMITNRSPQDVIEYCKEYVGGGYKTTSKVVDSIKFLDSERNDIPKDYIDYMFLHREDCDYYKDSLVSKKLYTVKTAQGNTFDRAVLVLPTAITLAYNHAYLYTALTRHTTELVVYGTKQQIERIFTIMGTAVERALEVMNIVPIDVPVVEIEKEYVEPHQEPVVDNLHVLKEDVEQILCNIFKPVNDAYGPNIDSRLNIIHDLKDGTPSGFSTKLEAVVDNYISIRGKRIGNRFFNKIYHPKDHATAIRGMLARYAENDVSLDKSYIGILNDAYMSLVDKDKLDKILSVGFTIDDMWYYTTEYLRKLQTKFPNKDEDIYSLLSYDDVTILREVMMSDGKIATTDRLKKMLIDTDIDEQQIDNFIKRLWSMLTDPQSYLKYKDIEAEWDDAHHTFVQFHMKKQPKEVRTDGYDGIFKAGQGVSAWSKMYNIMISGMIRYFSDIMNSIDVEYVQNSYNESDRDLSVKFKKRAGHTIRNNNIKKLVNDFKQFDSAQDETSILAFASFLKMLRMPEVCIKLYTKLRLRWVMALRGSNLQQDTITLLRGVFKKHSGEPATLDGNTWFNRAVTCMCIKWKNPYIAGFKGDDSIIIADEITIQKHGRDSLWKHLGYQFKVNLVKYPEYIANIITPEGFYPDLIRRTSRVISKIYGDRVDWEETRMSTADSLSVINNSYSELGISFLVEHYKEIGINITIDECKILHKFLRDVVINDAHKPEHVTEFYQNVY